MMNRRFSVALFSLVLCLQAFAQMHKVSPYVRRAVMEAERQETSADARSSAAVERRIMAFVRTDDTGLLRRSGCRILASWDDIHIADIPLSELNRLAHNPGILRIEAGESCCLTNDTVKSITGIATHPVTGLPARSVRNAYGLTGRGVVLGIMDVGFDLTHPTLWSSDMNEYRVRAFWDMLDYTEGGEPVTGRTDEGEDTVYVGRQYIGRDAILNKGCSADAALIGHGSHTLGTAGGSGQEGNGMSIYEGMAPDADLCVVCNMVSDNRSVVPSEDLYKYTTATDVLGFKYIFDYAQSVGKPCVINFSEGSHENLYDSELYSQVLSKMVGPGRILCASAGNEGAKNTHFKKGMDAERAGAFLTSSSEYAYQIIKSANPVKVEYNFYEGMSKVMEWQYDAAQLMEYPDSVMTDTLEFGDRKYCIMLQTYPSAYGGGEWATDVLIENLVEKKIDVSLHPVSLIVSSPGSEVEVFANVGYFAASECDPSLTGFTRDHNVLFPGTVDDVICVGATGYRNHAYNYEGRLLRYTAYSPGERASFSSVGPTMQGRIKPDVMAPGMVVVSASSSYMIESQQDTWEVHTRFFDYDGRTYGWWLNNGTSMAAPVVSGIIALWLEMDPQLTPAQIKEVLANTCQHTGLGMEYPNCQYGYGEIDAMAGADYVKNVISGVVSLDGQGTGAGAVCYGLSGNRVEESAIRNGVYIKKVNGRTYKIAR